MQPYIGMPVVIRSTADFAGVVTKVYEDGVVDVSYIMPYVSNLLFAQMVKPEREEGSLAWVWMTPEEARDNPFEPVVSEEFPEVGEDGENDG